MSTEKNSSSYYMKDGLVNLKKLIELKPELFGPLKDFDQKVFEEGTLSIKTKELIAVATAHITRCPFCIDMHVKKAKMAGVTDEELAEAIFVAIMMNSAAALAHACIAMDSLKR